MISEMTFDEDLYQGYDDEDFDDDESFYDDDEAAEFIGALLPKPLKFLDPVGAAIGAVAGGGRKRPAVRGARPGGLYSRPVPKAWVTQQQLKTSLAKVEASIKKNAAAIQAVSARANSNQARLNQQNRINARQGAQLRSIKKNMEQQAQTQMLVSLLNRTEEVEVRASSNAGEVPVGTRLTIEREIDPITFLLPALSGSDSGGSGLNNPLLLFALMGR